MRALISLSDKTGVETLGRGLAALGAEIYATGGTKRALEAAGVPVIAVSELTGFPEILGGRVKTLHPAVYGGILARRDVPADLAELHQHGMPQIDLVAVNLYPFERTVAQPGTTLGSALEQIDIGGPAMLRAAAKNHPAVLALCDAADYAEALEAMRSPEGADQALRRRLAAKAFRHVAVYDAFIAAYLDPAGLAGPEPGVSAWPEELPLGLRKMRELRYGENPQQQAALAALARSNSEPAGLAAAWAVAADFQPATVAIIKHTNPCGLAQAGDAHAAYELALSGDPLAAFGGIVAVNVPVDGKLARSIVDRFYEIVLAPAFIDAALEVLQARPDLRVLALPFEGAGSGPSWRSVTGGVLIQEADRVSGAEVAEGRVVTRRAPDDAEWAGLAFAWRAARHVKSNAIVLAQVQVGQEPRALALVGMGAGQPSRVAAVEIAARQAGSRASGAVLASDAFFPKADGVKAAASAGVRAIVQPGGSRGDREVIAAANAAGLAMVFTRTRHFLH
jgi:phosphoribosylaminoimidazolecarboxamide formyltransferase/IMP cyclohydrolase